jgi:acetyltransferase-like isoleucine patch superfamily enzyme
MKIFIKRIIRNFIKGVINLLKEEPDIRYKIGNIKHHNAFVDGLTPQFVEIGDNFVSAPGAYIISHDSSLFRHMGKYRVEKTIIGDKVYLGANSVILPGVKIGDGVIIGAGSVVTKDVVPFTVVAGVPAKFISTVDEYIKKCELKDCLYTPPKSYKKLFYNKRPNEKDKNQFQKKILLEAKQRGKL